LTPQLTDLLRQSFICECLAMRVDLCGLGPTVYASF